MSEHVLIVDESNFDDEILQSNLPVLVDFWAEWCGPCRSFAPIFDEVASKYLEKIKCAKINVDASGDLAARYNIRGIPTLILFRDGKVSETKVGMLSKEQLIVFIEENLV